MRAKTRAHAQTPFNPMQITNHLVSPPSQLIQIALFIQHETATLLAHTHTDT